GVTLVYLGLSGNPQSFNAGGLVTSLRSIAGINTGNIADTQEMLDLCGEKNIVSDIELLDATEASAIDLAYERVVKSDVRYRFVIDAATI
ncbi:MAG: alcohol dehydrogenase, partial [Aquiluna sp.]